MILHTQGNELEFVLIPSFVLKDRKVSVLEAIVEYLKDDKGFNYHDIGLLLNRNERTVWTCYSRAKKKRRNSRRKTS